MDSPNQSAHPFFPWKMYPLLKLNAKPMTQQMAPLPRSRLMAYKPPFSYPGMDLFGPLYVKQGRGTAKRWCCLFTCMNTRAVHLELVQSMGKDDFIAELRRPEGPPSGAP